MKFSFRKSISIYLSIIFTTIFVLVPSVSVQASISTDKIVQGYTSSFATGVFSYVGTGKYYVLNDTSDLPALGSGQSLFYFGKNDNDTFYCASAYETFTFILNKQLKLVVKPGSLANLFAEFVSFLQTLKDSSNKVEDGVYNAQGNLIGWAMADISGCHYINASVTIPSQTQINIYNFCNYYLDDDSSLQYFYVAGCPYSIYSSNWGANSSYLEILSSYSSLFYGVYQGSNNDYRNISINTYTFPSDVLGFVSYSTSDLSDSMLDALASYGVHKNGDTITMNSSLYSSSVLNLTLSYRDSTNFSYSKLNLLNGSTESQSGSYSVNVGNNNGNKMYLGNQTLLVYTNLNAYDSVNGGSFEPDYYITDSFNNYDVTSVTSTTVSQSLINQAVSNNSTIYSDSSTIFNGNINNGVIDNSTINNAIDNSINNTYIDNGGSGSDSSSDASSGNSGSDDGGGSGDGGLTLSELLAKLAQFLEAIGAFIAAVITGLLGMFTNIITALSGVTELVGSIGSFFGSIFDFLPTELVTVLVAAISVCILAAVIKFIRG